jgi:biopolymer transport protein ExbB/TolQ
MDALDAAKRASARSALAVRGEMKHGLSSLASIAFSAPLVGVIGALLGILDSFPPLGTEKWTGYAITAENLSNALMPIELGLLVALLAYFGHKHLLSRLEGFELEMENASLQLLNQLSATHS